MTLGPQYRLGRADRLIKRREFDAVYNAGRKVVGRHMILWSLPQPDAASRIGVVTSRKIGNAVVRNRARRRMRSLWRLARPRLKPGFDVILIARPSIATTIWSLLQVDFDDLAGRAGLHG